MIFHSFKMTNKPTNIYFNTKNQKNQIRGSTPKTPRFNANGIPKKKAKKRSIINFVTVASFFVYPLLIALVAPQRCHIP